MSGVSEAIGTFFERRLARSLPGVEDFRDAENAPDFRWGPVWVEAKAAFDASDYGILPKQYQFWMHQEYAPLIYACGYHDFEEATRRLTQRTMIGKLAHLERNASVTRMLLVSSSVIERLWERDARLNAKRTISYCRVPANTLLRIIRDGSLTRGGAEYQAREYFGINGELTYSDAEPVGYILTQRDYRVVRPRLQEIREELLFVQANGRGQRFPERMGK